MLRLGAALTLAAAISTWLATAEEDRVRRILPVWSDSISSLFLPSRRILPETRLTPFNSLHPPHPDNCSTCLFASGKDGSPVLVGQKLPHTNYSHFKLLLLPEDSRTLATDPSTLRNGSRWFWNPWWTISVAAVLAIVAWGLFSSLETHLRHRRLVVNGNTPADAASTDKVKGNDSVVISQEYHGHKKTFSEWLAASLLRGHQNLLLRWESISGSKSFDDLSATDGETGEGQPRPNNEEEIDTAWANKDEAFEADHDKNVLDLENEIERSLTDGALEQKRIAFTKGKDAEIESLRKKLDFTTGTFREFRRQHQECRTRNALHET